MRFQLNNGNIILADQAFIDQHHPGAVCLDDQPAQRVTRLTHDQLLRRLTPAEFKAIRAAAKVSDDVDMWLYRFERAHEINLSDQDTISGFLSLESAGLLAAGRAAEILSVA